MPSPIQQNRFEFKYILNPIQALEARHFIENAMTLDPSATDKGFYIVTSLYCDTPHRGDYYDKSGGFIDRKKIRVRIYESYLADTIQTIFLERKLKHDMTFLKTRVSISRAEWDLFMSRNFSKLLSYPREQQKQKLLESLMWDYIAENRQPRYLIRYKRWPYLARDGSDLRITFDESIDTIEQDSLKKPTHTTSVRPYATIMEVKFGHSIPPWFLLLLGRLHLTRSSFSKYAMSIDALNAYNPLPR